MKSSRGFEWTLLAASAVLMSGAFCSTAAQVPEPPTSPPQATPVPREAAPLDEQKLDQYADAYLAIEEIESRASAELKQADSRATAAAIKEKAEGAIIEAIERSGLELDEFNQITEVAARDADLRLTIASRVEERRRI